MAEYKVRARPIVDEKGSNGVWSGPLANEIAACEFTCHLLGTEASLLIF